MPDPAAVEGNEAERHLAFADTYRMLSNRISIFVSLPLASIDKLALQQAPRRDRPRSAARRGRMTSDPAAPPGGRGARHRPAGRRRSSARASWPTPFGATTRRAARQHAADRRDPRRADHHPRPGLRRSLQSGGHARLRAPARDRGAAGRRLRAGAAGRRDRWARSWRTRCSTFRSSRSPQRPTRAGQWLAEGVATFGLIVTILAGLRFRPDAVAWLVGLYITAAYWFTASTSFANPAVAIARAFSDTFAGIRPQDVPAFVLAEITGGMVALGLMGWLLTPPREQAHP